MSEKSFYTLTELSEMLEVHPVTLLRWRKAGKGPEFYTMPSGFARYKKTAVHTWMRVNGQ